MHVRMDGWMDDSGDIITLWWLAHLFTESPHFIFRECISIPQFFNALIERLGIQTHDSRMVWCWMVLASQQ